MLSEIETAPSGPQPAGRKVWLRWAVLCDGQRREDNGKRLLLGVYDHTVVSSRKPIFMVPKLVGAFELLEGGSHTLYFRVNGPSGGGIGSIVTGENSEPGGYVDFEVPVPTLTSEPGTIELDWRVDEDPWGPAMVWQVRFTDEPEELPDEQVQVLAAQMAATSDMQIKIGGTYANMVQDDENSPSEESGPQ